MVENRWKIGKLGGTEFWLTRVGPAEPNYGIVLIVGGYFRRGYRLDQFTRRELKGKYDNILPKLNAYLRMLDIDFNVLER